MTTTTFQQRREQINILMQEYQAKAKALGLHFDLNKAKLAARRTVLGN
jgi:hypothetical protein